MEFEPDIENQGFDGRYASAYLGVSQTTLRRLRTLGAIPAFRVPSRGARSVWRYRCLDLDRFIRENTGYARLAPPGFRKTFPVEAIADLLGVSQQDVRIQKHRGRLKGYDPVSVRNYLLRISRGNLIQEVQSQYGVSIDKLRLDRAMEGWDFERLAAVEGVEVQTIQASVARASRREHMIRHYQLMEMRQRGALANEMFRTQIRETYADKAAQVIGKLLDGQRDEVTVDKATGQVTIEHIVDDPETMAAGVDLYRKTTSLEEKPAAATVQVQKNAVINNRGPHK
jgi:hypothetical protein